MGIFLIVSGCQALPEQESIMASTDLVEGISADSLLEHIKILASDDFEGRAPGSRGEEKTIEYLTDQFSSFGLLPGNPDGTWVQKVSLVGITPVDGSTLTVRTEDQSRVFEPGTDYVAWTKRIVEKVDLGGELVFVGYGALAPEYEWDDFKGVDVQGKVLLMLVNDPPIEDIFGGKAMTYYGRWTYKLEVAAELGAEGAFVIHESEPAGYPWEVVGSNPLSESFDLVTHNRNMDRASVEGWMQVETAKTIFEMAGLDFDEQKSLAAQRTFQPVSLGLQAETTIVNTFRTVDSNNFLARLEGKEAPDEVVIYVAHWDHLGVDPMLTGDQIFNGAADNATGTAGLLELAKAFSLSGERPRRSVVFLAVTAEEQGLLGSRYYTKSPLYPPGNTVAVINMDVLNTWGRTRDLTVVGMGQSELDQVGIDAAGQQGRVLIPDPEPEKGFYYRSDHFSFARIGVPAFYADPGVDYIGKERGYGIRKREEYSAEDYHRPSDEVKADWDLTGAIEDLDFFYRMGYGLATSSDWPAWSETSEFRAIREAQMKTNR